MPLYWRSRRPASSDRRGKRRQVDAAQSPFAQFDFRIVPPAFDRAVCDEMLETKDNPPATAITQIFLEGGAGTGKTLLALAAALQQERDYEQIIISRPTVVLGNQDIGFLPGDQKSKMSPFLQPLMDNLNVIKAQFKPTSREAQRIESMLTMEKLVIEPLAYIRGRSLGRCYFIIDEAQNLTPHEIKTIITRAGEGCKMVFTGDVQQIDAPYLDMQSNGLAYMIDKMKGQEIFEHVNLVKGERSKLSEIASKLL